MAQPQNQSQVLDIDTVNQVYTFNGAGVGEVTASHTLYEAVSEFNVHRQAGVNAGLFTDAVALARNEKEVRHDA